MGTTPSLFPPVEQSPLFSPGDPRLLYVCILGKPVGAARPRVVRLKTGASHTFMPDNASAWEGRAIQLCRDVWSGAPLDEPLSLRVVAVCPRPKRLSGKRAEKGRIPALCKPDADNILKLCQDSLTKAGVIVDDTRIVDAQVVKLYGTLEPLEAAHVEITLRRWQP